MARSGTGDGGAMLGPMHGMGPEFFRRLDERPDALFYERPRTASHIDDAAMRAVQDAYRAVLPEGGAVLDLMAGVRSHLGPEAGRVVGLGLNAEELHANPRIDDAVVADVNRDPELPFDDASFDGAVCTVSVQYLVRPVATFASVGRVLRPGAPFCVAISTRMYEQKAVLAWRASDEAAHLRLVRAYFEASGAFGDVAETRHHPVRGDPVQVLWAAATAPA